MHTNDEARRTTCKYRRIIAGVTQSTRQRRDDDDNDGDKDNDGGGDDDDDDDDGNDNSALTRSHIHSPVKKKLYIGKRSLTIEREARERNGEHVARNRPDGINKNKRLATW